MAEFIAVLSLVAIIVVAAGYAILASKIG